MYSILKKKLLVPFEAIIHCTLYIFQVKCLDAFTQQQTRLVIIVDGLDSCEQDKVLLVLDAVHVLFSDANRPFIIILAIDPHVISKVSLTYVVNNNLFLNF